MEKVKVLHVDDSAVIRSIIKRIIQSDQKMELVAQGVNGREGVEAYKTHKPDIVVLDIEMPEMNGIQALEEIMKHDRNAKVIMCSTLTTENAEITLKAMKIGAIDYIAKPTSANEVNSSDEFKSQLLYLLNNIKKASTSASGNKLVAGMPKPTKALELRAKPPIIWKPKVIAIGSSTGGPQALLQLMKNMKGMQVPIVITQHMPATFTRLLAKNIANSCGLPCHEAEDGMVLKAGEAILAQGGKHLVFTKNANGQIVTKLSDEPPVNYCKPAVDPMIDSLMQHYNSNVLSVMLTGMGHDGRDSTKRLIGAGGYAIAQDQDSSIVWGMPGAVATEGLCSAVEPLDNLAVWIKNNINF